MENPLLTSYLEDILCLWIGRLNISKMAVITKLIYRFTVKSIKTPVNFFVETDKLILKFTWKFRRPRRDKTILKKKKKIGEFILFDFLTYYRATILR